MKQFSVPVQDHFSSLDLEPTDLLVLPVIEYFAVMVYQLAVLIF